MKYRVLKVGDKYFPQYKSWWTFGWRDYCDKWGVVCYSEQGHAKNFCKRIIDNSHKTVVWEYQE